MSWDIKPLGTVCTFQRGLTYAKGDEVASSSNVVLRATNIDLETNLLDFSELRYIRDAVEVPSNKKVRRGSLLVCTASGSKSHLGKIAYIDDDYGYAFGGFMGMITPVDDLDARYLFHLMTSPSYKEFIDALSDGANINNLKFDDLSRFPIPLPPLPEQRRIVGILDEAFAAIATAKANTETNLRNARALYDSFQDEIFVKRSSEWEVTTIGDLVSKGVLAKPQDGNHGEIHPVRADFVPSGVPFIMAADLQDGLVNTKDCRFITKKQATSLRIGFAQDGDVLISHKGTIGRVAVLKTDEKFVVLTPQVTYYRVLKPDILAREYLPLYLRSPSFQSVFNDIAGGGSTRAYIGITRQLSLSIIIPPVKEQLTLARKLSELHSETQRLAALYQQKLAALDALKKSLLHEAFSGGLGIAPGSSLSASVAGVAAPT